MNPVTSFVGAHFQEKCVKKDQRTMASLDDLPDEIITYIFSYLPSRQQVSTIPRVSRRFGQLVSSQWYWRSRYVQLCSAQPLTELPSVRAWQEGCLQEEFALRITNNTQNHTVLKGVIDHHKYFNW